MSAVLMCDNCGELFSVNQRGWSAMTITTSDPRDNNAHNHGAQTRHLGPCCNRSVGEPVRPRLSITGTVVDRESEK